MLQSNQLLIYSGWAEQLPDSPPSGDRNTPEPDLQSMLHTCLVHSPLNANLSLSTCGTARPLKLRMQVCFLLPVSNLELIVHGLRRLLLPSSGSTVLVCFQHLFGFVLNRVLSKFDFQPHPVVRVCMWGLDSCLQCLTGWMVDGRTPVWERKRAFNGLFLPHKNRNHDVRSSVTRLHPFNSFKTSHQGQRIT